MKLELVLLPVADVDRAKAFFTERLGFALDVDTTPTQGFRVVQMTPPGSACSITVGTGSPTRRPARIAACISSSRTSRRHATRSSSAGWR